MGFWQRVTGPFRKKSIDVGESTGMAFLPGQPGYLGRRGVQETLAAFNTSPWFRGVVERVSYAAASVPWRLFAVRNVRKGGSAFIRHIPLQTAGSLESRKKIMSSLEDTGALTEISDHLLLLLLSEPNSALTGVDTRMVTIGTLMVAGEIGWWISKDDNGTPNGIWPIPPHWISKRPGEYDSNGKYLVHVGAKPLEFDPDEFVLFRNPSLVNPYGRGTGMGTALADELETDEYISKFQKAWFHSRGRPDLIVSVSSGDQDLIQRQGEMFDNTFRDATRGSRSMWVKGDDVKITELSQKLIDLDLTEQRKWLKDLVREVFGIPPEIMGDVKNSNRATVNEARAILMLLTVIPMLERIRAQMQKSLVPMFDQRLALNFWDPTPEDREFRLKAVMAIPYTATRGEIRRLQGLEDRGDKDNIHIIPTGLGEVPAPRVSSKSVSTWEQLVDRAVKAVSNADADAVAEKLQPRKLERELKPEIKKTVEDWGNRALVELGLEASFDMRNPAVEDFISEFGAKRMEDINDHTKSEVRRVLRAGVAAGDSADQLAKRLREKFTQFDKTRSLTIARTEVTRSANFGQWAAHKASGVVDERRWLATPDGRARDEHLAMNNQKRGIDKPFTAPGGKTAMYPGEFDVASLDVRCRCTTIAVVADPKSSDVDVYKAFEDQTERDEDRIANAARRGFSAQFKDLLQALEEIA